MVNLELPITNFEHTVEDRLSEWNPLFQAEEALFNRNPIHSRAHLRQN